MPARRSLPPVLRGLPVAALVLGLGACADDRPAITETLASRTGLSQTYVLQAVSGRALPAQIAQFSARVYRVHADTLHFDQPTSTFQESALIGGRDTTVALEEAVSLRLSGPVTYESRSVSGILLWNFMGLGRADATIHDGGLTVVARGERFSYALVAR